MTGNPYPSPLDQAFLRLWVGVYGPDSSLARYLKPRPSEDVAPPAMPLRDGQTLRRRRVASSHSARISDVAELPAWARSLVGSPLIAEITLDDVLTGLDDFFWCFTEMRRVSRDAYRYFSRVGAPLYTPNSLVWDAHVDLPRFPDAGRLPAYFGVFVGRSREEARADQEKDASTIPDFCWFEKVRNAGVAARQGVTVFAHNVVFLRREGLLTQTEEKTHPWARKSLGVNWYVGVDREGNITALPHRVSRVQVLPRSPRKVPGGGSRKGRVHRSAMAIPDGLYELGHGDPHDWVRKMFCASVALCATGAQGLQVAVRRGGVTARLGVPIGAVRGFFKDRDTEDGARRAAILHLRRPHERTLKDGRTVSVGAYLAGARRFSWHGYDVSVGAPGLHYPAPEGFRDGVFDAEEELPSGVKLIGVRKLGEVMRHEVWKDGKTRFRRGVPRERFASGEIVLPEPEPEAAT